MTIESRVEILEEITRVQHELNKNTTEILKVLAEDRKELRALLEETRQDTRYTRRIWIAVAKKMELWDELEEDGLA